MIAAKRLAARMRSLTPGNLLISAAVIIAAILIFLSLAWWIAIPDGALFAEAAKAAVMRSSGLRISLTGFSKSPFYALRADGITVEYQGRTAKPLKEINASVPVSGLLRGKASADISAIAAGGRLAGTVSYTGGAASIDIRVERASLAELLALAPVSGSGVVDAQAKLVGGIGEIRFSVKEMKLETSGPLALLPLDKFKGINGVIDMSGREVHVKGLEIEGDSLHGRIKGKITDGSLDLAIEIFPDAAFSKDNSFILAGLLKYQESPGHYKIPVTGTIARPVVR
ncbi:MAG: type II secretion system protein GspN [Nitrospirae bacterium]|nr:type II secretion system protein GspN [Nitrospirota bacterium]